MWEVIRNERCTETSWRILKQKSRFGARSRPLTVLPLSLNASNLLPSAPRTLRIPLKKTPLLRRLLRRSTAHSRSKIPCADVWQEPRFSCKNADSAGSPMRSTMPVKHGTTFRNARMRSREPSRKKPHSKRFRKPERVRSKRHSPPERAP